MLFAARQIPIHDGVHHRGEKKEDAADVDEEREGEPVHDIGSNHSTNKRGSTRHHLEEEARRRLISSGAKVQITHNDVEEHDLRRHPVQIKEDEDEHVKVHLDPHQQRDDKGKQGETHTANDDAKDIRLILADQRRDQQGGHSTTCVRNGEVAQLCRIQIIGDHQPFAKAHAERAELRRHREQHQKVNHQMVHFAVSAQARCQRKLFLLLLHRRSRRTS
mmetsp:Transcript_30463/g.48865  ORF Transcript_30463/g.48865 Transcript_30463/m.48865 type:complete len:219 (-) Transcript_30463:911-1567(-)